MEQRIKIISGAEKIFMRQGIKSVTMDDVARGLGISKKTLYQHVENKSDLIEQVMHFHLASEITEIETIREQSNDSIEELLNLSRYTTQLLREMNPIIISDLKRYHKEAWSQLETLHLQQIYIFIRANIEKGIEQGLYRSDLDPDIIARLYGGGTMLMVNEEMFPLKEYNKEKLFEVYIQYHIHGIASAKGLKRLNKCLTLMKN